MANTTLLSWDAFWNFINIQSDTIKRANYLQIKDELDKIARGSDQALKDEVFKCAPEDVKVYFRYGEIKSQSVPQVPSKLITREMRLEALLKYC